MTEQHLPEIEFEQGDFDFDTIEEEVRVDERCRSLMKSFCTCLLNRGEAPQVVSELAFCADFYLRDYLMDFARLNILRPVPGVVRRFAATWLITRTLDPDMAMLERHLKAIREFYGFLQSQNFISSEDLAWLEEEACQTDYYRQRIESFLSIKDDEYVAWEAECPLRD